MINQSSKVHSFTGSALRDLKTQALAAKTTVTENSGMSAKLPDLRPALVNIIMKGGSTFSQEIETNRGDWQDPYDNTQLKDKYMSLTARRWSNPASEAVYKNLMVLDELSNVSNVFGN